MNAKQHTWNRDTLNDGDLLDDEFDAIYENFTEVNGSIATEASARSSADSALQSNIDAEATARINADNLKANKAGDTFTGQITIPDGTASVHAVNKSQLDAEATTRTAALALKVDKTSVVNSDSSTSTVDPVSAYQVKLIKDSITAILGVLNSTNADLDTMQEVVNFIQSNKTTLDVYATMKVNVSDIINDFVSDIANQPASAHTVFVLKVLVDNLGTGKVDKVTGKALSTLDVTTEMIEVNSIPLGMPFPQWFDEHLLSVVSKYPSRFIKLSKDSAYNTGKLTSQTAHTADETTFYTAIISDSSSPLNGASVTLINSVQNETGIASSQPAFLGANETPQVRLANRFQGFGIFDVKVNYETIPAGNSRHGVTTNSNPAQTDYDEGNHYELEDDGNNGLPRIGKTTRPDTVTAVYYMRIW